MKIRALCRSAVVVLPLSVVAAASCKDDNSGALMLAMSTDLSVPDDVTAVGLQIESDGRPLVNLTQLVVKTSDGNVVRLPATFAVTPAADRNANPKIRVRVVAYQGQNPIVLRQAISTVPRGRIGLLRMPLLFANRSTLTVASAVSASSDRNLGLLGRAEALPSEISDTCARDETRIDGVCKDANVDSSTLPTCSSDTCDDLLFGASSGAKTCMSISACFLESPRVQSWKLPVVAAEKKGDDVCTVALPEAYRATRDPRNFVITVPDNTGACAVDKTVERTRTRSDCYVAIRPNTAVGAEGYIDHGDGTYGMPSWVCTQMKAGRSVQVTTGCDAEFGPGIELCPLDRPADLSPIKFTKSQNGPFMSADAGSDGGSDGGDFTPGKSGGISFFAEAAPEQLMAPRYDDHLYVLGEGQKMVRATITGVDCTASDGGAPMPLPMPANLRALGGMPRTNRAVFDVPRLGSPSFSLLELPNMPGDVADMIGATRIGVDNMTGALTSDGTFLVRALGMAFTYSMPDDYLFVVAQTQAGATTLQRKNHQTNMPSFAALEGNAMVVTTYGGFTGAVAGIDDSIFTAHKKPGVAGTLVRWTNPSTCSGANVCLYNSAGTTMAEGSSEPSITSIVTGAGTPTFFTATTPGSLVSEIYMTSGSISTRLTKSIALEQRGPLFPPPQIVADDECVYAIQKSGRVGNGVSTHEIVCIEYNEPPVSGEYPRRVLAEANNARGLAVYQYMGRATVFWGEASRVPSSSMTGQVRCISRTVAGG